MAASGKALRFVGVSGSLRKASTNTGLLRYAQTALAKEGVSLEMHDISGLPMFNQDLEPNAPDAVREFKEAVKSADGVIFACPEYNYGLSGALKNALDWGSRTPNCWDGKPAAVMGAGGGFGTKNAQYHLRGVCVFLNVHLMNKPEVCIKRFEKKGIFSDDGDLIEEEYQKRVDQLCASFIQFAKRSQ
ncbi:unnamed protein product [Vitrella brassicaformis CCMP3155]|uniref:NADPH-dependent FMN reductase-like domain-containing protein n=1 Tax=Vitrella brassicaformis (strain CCMP3155) TaxID=1169540 RepID=A0A0G4EXG8_VITBC|nr:unnamed protein product [Vitrella brassicaformis CCMP3155]|eukprot:CEM03498.1 unnamed protein product [Vitrella brassicaformis CCMP3155]